MVMKGLVYKSTGSWYKVRNNNYNFIVCRLKGKLRIKVSMKILVYQIFYSVALYTSFLFSI